MVAAQRLEKLAEKVKQNYAQAQYVGKPQTAAVAAATASPAPLTPLKRLETAMSQKHELARAVIYSEILGPPLAMRQHLGHEWS
jgi:hypothetical protein